MSTVEIVSEVEELSLAEPMFRLSKDTRNAAKHLSRANARWLVDRYYEVQEDRKRAANQLRANLEQGEPSKLIEWSYRSIHTYEQAIKATLGHFAASYRVGAWLQSITGIGPVLSAGLLAAFEIQKAPTVGHFWRFAGLDPSLKWPGREGAKKAVEAAGLNGELSDDAVENLHLATGQHARNIRAIFTEGYTPPKGAAKKGSAGVATWLARRPWNARLKSFCLFRMGEVQVKFQNHASSFYGPLFAEYKRDLEARNARGEFGPAAAEGLERVGKATEAYKAYAAGLLPQAQIHNRARRWMVKLIVSHLHHQMYRDYWEKDPPAPYIFTEHPDASRHTRLHLPPGEAIETFAGRRLLEMEAG